MCLLMPTVANAALLVPTAGRSDVPRKQPGLAMLRQGAQHCRVQKTQRTTTPVQVNALAPVEGGCGQYSTTKTPVVLHHGSFAFLAEGAPHATPEQRAAEGLCVRAALASQMAAANAAMCCGPNRLKERLTFGT